MSSVQQTSKVRDTATRWTFAFLRRFFPGLSYSFQKKRVEHRIASKSIDELAEDVKLAYGKLSPSQKEFASRLHKGGLNPLAPASSESRSDD